LLDWQQQAEAGVAHDAFVDFAGATRGGVHHGGSVDLWRDTRHGNSTWLSNPLVNIQKTMENMERTTVFNENHHAING
jgi:hypothetical protein